MRTTITVMLHQGHTSAAKMDQLAEAFWWPGTGKYRRKLNHAPVVEPQVRTSLHKFRQQKNNLEILIEPNQEINWTSLVQSSQRLAAMYIFW